MIPNNKFTYILVAEDDEDDQELIRDAMLDIGIPKEKIKFVDDGIALIAALKSAHRHPCFILLDLNMPKCDGLTVIDTLKKDEKLNTIPVVVLSTSEKSTDIQNCLRAGANAYLTKPPQYSVLVDKLMATSNFFIGHNEYA
jgi:CheY-like chemotaxis protein